MIVNNVTLQFLPAGAPAAEAVLAPNQHVYIDTTAGTMSHLQTNAKGLIVGAPLAASAVGLDDSRDYQVVVSPTALASPPAATQGVTLRVASGKLMVPPHIAVKISSTAAGVVGNLACSLTVGTTVSKVTSTSAGWIISNDKGSGVVSLRSDTKTLSGAAPAATAATATLTLAPTAPKRGETTTISVAAPSGAVGFKVTAWVYEIEHTLPGSGSASTATVTRPATEDPNTFDQSWTGTLVASGKLKLSFATGLTLRTTGDAAVKATANASDVVETTQDITVAPRTGAEWLSKLVEKPVADLVTSISKFEDVGEHDWKPSGGSIKPAAALKTGPNRGCEFVASATVTFTSTPKINKLLSDANSAFSRAQGKAYLVTPAPVRPIPSNLYTIGAKGAITIKDEDDFRSKMGIGDAAFSFSAHCIDQARLLSGTRRHESEDPAPNLRSHKGNCLKARRALDPITFAETVVKLPGETLDIANTVSARIQLVADVGPIHDIVDEAKSLKNQAVELIASATILDVNVDDKGAMIGPVWNPSTNTMLAN